MPRVLPFPGLRYAAPSADLDRLICPPYDVISPEEQARLESLSPHNAVRLELPADVEGESGSRYQRAAMTLAAWREARVLRTDAQPSFYLSETGFTYAGESLRRRDLLAAIGVEPWSTDSVLPHEHTMSGPKADRLQLMRATHLNASPIWVMHRDPVDALTQAWAAAEAREPLYEFTWRDEQHRVWAIDDAAVEGIQAGFAHGGALYIADGHHRYETALAFRAEAGDRVAGASGMLATVTWADDPGLLALPTHRLLHGVDPSLTMEELETRWSDAFHVEYYPVWDDAPAEQIDALMQQLASSGRVAPSIGVYGLDHHDLFGIFELRGRKAPVGALPADRSDAWKSLDVALLHVLMVDPLLVESGRARDQVLSYVRDPHQAIQAVRQGQASLAFFLNPTPVQSVLAVADAQDLMPEKSTYFHPKPPAGLVMRSLDVL